jgi:general secretion pathway protein G
MQDLVFAEQHTTPDYNESMTIAARHRLGLVGRAAHCDGPRVSLLPRLALDADPRFAGPLVVRSHGGFTLIEIMVVIVILGVLAALVVPRVLDRPDEARNIAARSDLATISSALKLYRLDNQRFPTTEQGLGALVAKPEQPPVPPNWKPGGYLERLPKDPWGRPYQYLNPGLKSEVDVFSFGADGQPGGTGIDADVGSWDL